MKKGNTGGLQRDNAAAMKKKSLFRMVKPYLFLLPIYLLMVTFKYIPFGMAIIKSFFNWNGANVNLFVGLDNYIAAFRDITFTKSLVNSLWIAGADILIVLTFPLLAAELLYAVKSTKKQYVVRTAFTFPMVVPSVVIILLWKWILAGDTGVLNNILTSIGIGNLAKPWLGDSRTALGSIIAIGFPWLGSASLGGLQFLLYFGALQNISKDMFEAAEIDGANGLKRFFHITLPMLSPTMFMVTILSLISSFQVFDLISIMTEGGPGRATNVLVYRIYQEGFKYLNFGYASAMAYFLFLIILIITLIQFRGQKKWVTYMQ